MRLNLPLLITYLLSVSFRVNVKHLSYPTFCSLWAELTASKLQIQIQKQIALTINIEITVSSPEVRRFVEYRNTRYQTRRFPSHNRIGILSPACRSTFSALLQNIANNSHHSCQQRKEKEGQGSKRKMVLYEEKKMDGNGLGPKSPKKKTAMSPLDWNILYVSINVCGLYQTKVFISN